MSVFKKVHTFNKEVIGIDRTIVSPLVFGEAEWLVNAMEEEAKEYVIAWDADDIPGQVDALIDLMYFTVGGLCRLGLTVEQMEKCFDIVHSANMRKTKGRKEREVEHDLDAVKPDDWEKPESEIEKTINGDTK